MSNFTRILSEKSEAKGKESEAKKKGHDDHGEEGGFPLVFFLFVVGFLVMLFFDQVLFKQSSLDEKSGEHDAVTIKHVELS